MTVVYYVSYSGNSIFNLPNQARIIPGKIAYVTESSDLLVKHQTSHLTKTIAVNIADHPLSFSPDGTKLLFSERDKASGESAHLIVYDFKTKRKRKFRDLNMRGYASWVGNSHILYDDLVFYDLSNNKYTEFSKSLKGVKQVSESQRGDRLVVAKAKEGKGREILVGSERKWHRIFRFTSRYKQGAIDWIGNQHIGFISQKDFPSQNSFEILILKKRTGNVVRRFKKKTEFYRDTVIFAASPDGKRLLISADSDSEEQAVWLFDLQAGKSRKISQIFGALAPQEKPVWMPDSKHFLFIGSSGGLFDSSSLMVGDVNEDNRMRLISNVSNFAWSEN